MLRNTVLLVQENEIKEYKQQIKAERKARKAAESWLRSELKSRVSLALPSAVLVICFCHNLCKANALTCETCIFMQFVMMACWIL